MAFAKTMAIMASLRGAASILVEDEVAFKSEVHAHGMAALDWQNKALTQHVSVTFPMAVATPPSSLAQAEQTNQASYTLEHCPDCSHHTEICFNSAEEINGAQQVPDMAVDEEFLKMDQVTLMSGDAIWIANMETTTLASGKYCCTGTLPDPKAMEFAVTMCHHLPDGMSLLEDSKIVEAKVQEGASDKELNDAAEQLAGMVKHETKAFFKVDDRIYPKAASMLEESSSAQSRLFSKATFPAVAAALLVRSTEPGAPFPESRT